VSEELTVRTLSADLVRRNLDDLIAVASDVPGEYWAAENFLADLPEKWRLSFGLWRDGFLIGYAILSQRAPRHVHLHHFMVSAARRNHGYGKRLLDEMIERCVNAGATKLTLKTQRENSGAIRFYARHGFVETGVESDHTVMTKSL
jgi:ribosomal protein S18 acetylase RimI-like enzyme